MKPTLQNIAAALRESWSSATAYDPADWSENNPARGQCVVSSLVVQDYLGGELVRYSIDEGNVHETHYVNKLNDSTIVDTTASQYTHPITIRLKPITLDGFASIREKRLTDKSTLRRYKLLKRRVDNFLTNNSPPSTPTANIKEFHKLVRDRIPEIIANNGETPHYRTLENDEEYLHALLQKDIEESVELAADPNLEELADKLEVIYAIGRTLGYSPEEIEQARVEKAQKRGGFVERIFLETTE